MNEASLRISGVSPRQTALTAQLGQQVLRMDRLGENIELVALGAGFLQKVGGRCLAGK
jgi:hypothetical protein